MRTFVLCASISLIPSLFACGGEDWHVSAPPSAVIEAPQPSAELVVIDDGAVTAGKVPSFSTAEATTTLASAELDFGTVRISDGAKRTIGIVNASDTAIPIRLVGFSEAEIVAANPFEVLLEYASDDQRVISVDAHSSRNLLIYFVPRIEGGDEATYGLHLCDGGCVTNLTLRGVGTH